MNRQQNHRAPETISTLRRVLEAERAGGCANRAVIGGLDRLAENLALRPDVLPDSAVAGVLADMRAAPYGAQTPDLRRRRLDGWLAALEGRILRPADSVGAQLEGDPPIRKSPMSHADTRERQAVATASAAPAPHAAASLATRMQRREDGARSTPAARVRPPPRTRELSAGLDSPVTEVPGVGAGKAEVLARLGIHQVRDLLFHFPNRHDDFSQIVPVSGLREGEIQTVVATVWSAAAVQLGPAPRKSTELIVGDETGNLRVIFFNNPYPAAQLRTNQKVTLSGRATQFRGQRQLENPEWELVEAGGELEAAIHTGRLVPVYPLTQGIQNRALRRLIRSTVDRYAGLLVDHLPGHLIASRGLPDLESAVRQAHYPDDQSSLERARQRLAYDELLTLQTSVLMRRAERQSSRQASPLTLDRGLLDRFAGSLPFALTRGQRNAIDSVLRDLELETPMARLLQGDVGSGKTVVAVAALLAAVSNERQSVLMAPTEILADQHYRTLCRLFGGEDAAPGDATVFECRPPWLGRPVTLAILRGGLRALQKRRVQGAIADGSVHIAVGTQALIQAGVDFARLGLTVVDEQHRFGVLQRAALADKGAATHLLVMTATPIPRTLALSLYGDLDLSLIDELPPGRKPVITKVVEPGRRDDAYRFVRGQIESGGQAFVICPLVEESETLEVRAATEEFERLSTQVFPDLKVSLLHGRMPPAGKDAVMRAFRDREADVLVSTAVVEVGIDIPHATVILIEDAERFGLAQLHQFRGRVGRAGTQSFCLLLSESRSFEAQRRLKLLEHTNNGLELAEADLRLRGPGDYFGTRQSGLATLRLARLGDTRILEAAREDAAMLVAADPTLSTPEMAALRRRLVALLAKAGDVN